MPDAVEEEDRMSEPSYRIENIKDGYKVVWGDGDVRKIYPLADGTGRWMVLGRAGIDFPSVEAAAHYVVNEQSLPGMLT